MIVGIVTLRKVPSFLFFPGYTVAVMAVLAALITVLVSSKLTPQYIRLAKSQIFANLGAMVILAFSDLDLIDFKDHELFYIEMLIDSLFHFASWCYVIMTYHRYVLIVNLFGEFKWTEKIPIPIVLCSTALLSLVKTSFVKISYGATGSYIGTVAHCLLVGSPLAQILLNIAMDAKTYRSLRGRNNIIPANNTELLATNRNAMKRVLSQSAIGNLPNVIFLLLLAIPHSTSIVVGSLATIGLQIFDVIVDSWIIVSYNRPESRRARRNSLSMTVVSETAKRTPVTEERVQEPRV